MPVTNIASVDEHERRPEDRPDADLVRGLAGREQDRDDRDHRLRQRGPDRREHRADGPLGQFELPSEPLDAVGEQLGAEQDDDEGQDQDQDVHRLDGTSERGRDPQGDDPEDGDRDPDHHHLPVGAERDGRRERHPHDQQRRPAQGRRCWGAYGSSAT